MKRWAARLVAIALLWMVFPGGLEATENLAHLLARGHLAHAAEGGDSHADRDAEHGCSATFHLCSCHVAPAGLLAAVGWSTSAADTGVLFIDRAVPGPTGPRQSIDRPPRP